MFGLDPVVLVLTLFVGFLAEIALLWVATALGDTPEQGWPKLIGIGLGVFAASVAIAAGIAAAFGILHSPMVEENRNTALAAAALATLASAVLPALAYPALLSVSMGRGAWVGIVQSLLRVFLYVLLTALVMVGLAVFQISRGPGEGKSVAPVQAPK